MWDGKGERTLVPQCHLPFSLPPIICKPGLWGMQGFIDSPFNQPPPPLPLTHQQPPSFKLWISPCIRVEEEEFVNCYPRWLSKPFVFLTLSCWMSSSTNIIWIFVSFVGLIAIVSGNRLNFFDGYQFQSSENICFTVDQINIFSIISILLMSL